MTNLALRQSKLANNGYAAAYGTSALAYCAPHGYKAGTNTDPHLDPNNMYIARRRKIIRLAVAASCEKRLVEIVDTGSDGQKSYQVAANETP